MNLDTLWTTLQVVIIIVLAIFVAYAVSVWRDRRAIQALLDAADFYSTVAHGTADWNRNAFPGIKPGPLFLGAANGSAMYYDGDQHLITIAPTRTGKGTCHIIPNLLTYPGSMVVNDIKGENYKLSGERRGHFGKVFRFAPFENNTSGFNPLDFVRRGTPAAFDDAMLIADMLIVPGKDEEEGNHWKEAAKNLLAGLIGYVSETEEGERNMQRVRQLLTLNQKAFLEFVRDKMTASKSAFVVRAANILLQKADRERSGVVSTAQAQTTIWDSEHLSTATKVSSFGLEELRDQVATLYIIIPPEHLSTYKGVLRVVLGLALSTMTRQLPTRNDRPPLTFLFDEFPSLGYMQPIVDGMAYLAGYGCRLWLFAQDLGQIRETYGDKATSLLANCGARSFFGVADYETAEYVSKMVGQKTIRTSSRTFKTSKILFWADIWGVETQSLQYVGVPLITPDEVMRIPTWGDQQRQIVFLQGQRPVLAYKIPYQDVAVWAAAAVRAPVSVQLNQSPMPPSDVPEASQQPEVVAATGTANRGVKIPLATKPGSAYIKGGNKRKGQGMTATYELIEESEANSEKMHESMVQSAQRAREAEQKAKVLQNELATLPSQDPRREGLLKHIELLQLIVQTARENVSDGRLVLDAESAFAKRLKDGS